MAPRPGQAPQVLLWYRVYCGLMAGLYLLVAAGGGAMLVFRDKLADRETADEFWLAYGFLMVVLGVILLLVFLAAFFLPRKPWAWIYHLVLIALGMTSACCLPACIPLLIFWVNAETRAYFGWETDA